jgi:hypothetical protein
MVTSYSLSPNESKMERKGPEPLSRLLASLMCVVIAIALFITGNDYMTRGIEGLVGYLLWAFGLVLLVISIAVLFHHRPGWTHKNREDGLSNPKTEHENSIGMSNQRERELDHVRIDSHMVDRKW